MVIQYCTARVRSPEDDGWRMLVSELNTCSGMRSLGIVYWARSSIVTAGVVE